MNVAQKGVSPKKSVKELLKDANRQADQIRAVICAHNLRESHAKMDPKGAG